MVLCEDSGTQMERGCQQDRTQRMTQMVRTESGQCTVGQGTARVVGTAGAGGHMAHRQPASHCEAMDPPNLSWFVQGPHPTATRQSHLLEGRGLRNAEGWVRRVSVICTMLVTPHWQREPERKPKGECAWGEERQFRGPCEPGAWVMGFPQGWRHVFPPGECCFSSVPCAWGSNIHVPFLLRFGF